MGRLSMWKLLEVVKDLLANPMVAILIGFALAVVANLLTPVISKILAQRSRRRKFKYLLRKADSISRDRKLKEEGLHNFHLVFLSSSTISVGVFLLLLPLSTIMGFNYDPTPVESAISVENIYYLKIIIAAMEFALIVFS